VQQAIAERRARIAALVKGDVRPAALASPVPLGRRRVPGEAAAARPATVSAPQAFTFDGEHAEAGDGAAAAAGGSGGGGGGRFIDSASVASAAPALTQPQLREMFEFYCNFGRSAVMTYQVRPTRQPRVTG